MKALIINSNCMMLGLGGVTVGIGCRVAFGVLSSFVLVGGGGNDQLRPLKPVGFGRCRFCMDFLVDIGNSRF